MQAIIGKKSVGRYAGKLWKITMEEVRSEESGRPGCAGFSFFVWERFRPLRWDSRGRAVVQPGDEAILADFCRFRRTSLNMESTGLDRRKCS